MPKAKQLTAIFEGFVTNLSAAIQQHVTAAVNQTPSSAQRTNSKGGDRVFTRNHLNISTLFALPVTHCSGWGERA